MRNAIRNILYKCSILASSSLTEETETLKAARERVAEL